jgi:hypothetical protein
VATAQSAHAADEGALALATRPASIDFRAEAPTLPPLNRSLRLVSCLAIAACGGQTPAASPHPEAPLPFVSSSEGTDWAVRGTIVGHMTTNGKRIQVLVDSATVSGASSLRSLGLAAIIAGTAPSKWRLVARSHTVDLGPMNGRTTWGFSTPLAFDITLPGNYDPNVDWLVFEFISRPQSGGVLGPYPVFTTYTCPDSASRPGLKPPHIC